MMTVADSTTTAAAIHDATHTSVGGSVASAPGKPRVRRVVSSMRKEERDTRFMASAAATTAGSTAAPSPMMPTPASAPAPMTAADKRKLLRAKLADMRGARGTQRARSMVADRATASSSSAAGGEDDNSNNNNNGPTQKDRNTITQSIGKRGVAATLADLGVTDPYVINLLQQAAKGGAAGKNPKQITQQLQKHFESQRLQKEREEQERHAAEKDGEEEEEEEDDDETKTTTIVQDVDALPDSVVTAATLSPVVVSTTLDATAVAVVADS